MTGTWVLAAAVLALPAAWFLIGRPLAAGWGGRWWGKGHSRRAALRELRVPEAAAGVWPGGTGWMLLVRLSAGAGGLWLLWPAGAAAGGWAGALVWLLVWLLGVWLLLCPVRDYTILYASVRRGQAGPQAGRLSLLLGWVFCVLALAVLSGRTAAALQTVGPPSAAGPSAATAAVLVSCEAVCLGVILQYAGLRRGLRSLLLLAMPLAALAVGLVCPIALGGKLLLALVLFSAFCAAAAPSWVLTRPRAALCASLLALCLAAGILAAASFTAQPTATVPFEPGGFWALLFAAGGGAAAGLQTVAAGCTAAGLVRPEDFAAGTHPTPRQERAVFAVGFGGMLMIGLLAAAALAVYCIEPAGQAGGAAGYAAALAARLARFGLPTGQAKTLVYMAAALPALCGLDAAAAAGRSALQGIFGSASLPPQKLAPWRKLLRSRPMASLFTVLPALFFAGRADALLPLLDGLGWLLSGLAMLLALAAHRQAGRKTGWLWPLAAALLCAGWLSLGRHAAVSLQNNSPAAAGACFALMLAGLWAAAGTMGRLWKGQNAKKAARKPLAESAAASRPPKGE